MMDLARERPYTDAPPHFRWCRVDAEPSHRENTFLASGCSADVILRSVSRGYMRVPSAVLCSRPRAFVCIHLHSLGELDEPGRIIRTRRCIYVRLRQLALPAQRRNICCKLKHRNTGMKNVPTNQELAQSGMINTANSWKLQRLSPWNKTISRLRSHHLI